VVFFSLTSSCFSLILQNCFPNLVSFLSLSSGERPYKCPHCDYAGTQSGSLKYHLQRHHREQRNALSASSNSSSSGLASTINTLTSATSGPAKQRRSQPSHCPVNRVPTDCPPASRPGQQQQQSWLLGLPDQRDHRKTLAALRDVDLETQYRYLSGVMGALYQGGMEGGWIRESPPPKAPKVSRRKPLTTSRMVQPPIDKEGPSTPSTREVGFEPLDLSRRPSPGLGSTEENGGMSLGDVGGVAVAVGGGDGVVGDSSIEVKLSQCLFCPFRTSSAELMAMHLQVNHTSKSRRKRAPSATLDDEGAPRAAKPRTDHSDLDALTIWRHVTEAESQAPLGEWSSKRAKAPNGLSEETHDHLDEILAHGDGASASENVRGGLALKGKTEADEEEEEEQEDELEEILENSSLEDSEDQDLRMALALSPALSASHTAGEEERVFTD